MDDIKRPFSEEEMTRLMEEQERIEAEDRERIMTYYYGRYYMFVLGQMARGATHEAIREKVQGLISPDFEFRELVEGATEDALAGRPARLLPPE